MLLATNLFLPIYKNVGSAVEWLNRLAYDQHGLGSKPTRSILWYPWERHFTAQCKAKNALFN